MQKKYIRVFLLTFLKINWKERQYVLIFFFYLTYSGQGSDFNRVCSKKAINILR
jgi:hypothetical protein